jgi:hypothetical protein
MSDNVQLFGSSYSQFGNSDSDLLLKTRGKVKVQYGSKFIDIIKDGKINSDTDFIFSVKSLDKISKNGIYIVNGDSVYVKFDKLAPIFLAGSSDNTYVSFLTKQETTANQKYTALSNIGFSYKSISDVSESSLQNGIIYVEDTKQLYIVVDGQLSEYTIGSDNTFHSQVKFQKSDDNKGVIVIKGTGIENSIAFDYMYLYSDTDANYLISNGAINIGTGTDNIVLVIDNNSVTCNYKFYSNVVRSLDYDEYSGFNLQSLNGKTEIHVDDGIFRSKLEVYGLNVRETIEKIINRLRVIETSLNITVDDSNKTEFDPTTEESN